MRASSLAASTPPATGQHCPNVPSLGGCTSPAVTPPNLHGMAATEEVGIREGGRKDGKKQEEGGRKVVAELAVLFGPKGGWVGTPGMQLGWRKGVCTDGGGVSWPHPPVLLAPPHVPSHSLQLLQKAQELVVPLIGLVQVAGVSGVL